MKRRQGIRQKLTNLIVLITIISLLAASGCSIAIMMNMRKESLKTTTEDALTQLTEMADSRADLADSMLTLAQSQTLLVADGMAEILSDTSKYLKGYNTESLVPLNTTTEEFQLVNALMPEELLTNVVKETKNDKKVVTSASVNGSLVLSSGLSVNEELYLGSLLSNELAQIYRFKTPGTEDEYKGFAASYFCYADSGIDILGDPKGVSLISYEPRNSAWYTGAVDALAKGTLTEAGVFWTEPSPDAAGRGMSMMCSCPVVVDGKVVGVAGSGGLINDFAELVKSSTIGSTGYSFMVSRNTSKVILNPTGNETSEVALQAELSSSENAAIKDLCGKIFAGNSGRIDDITIDGVPCYLAYSALDNNEWTMVTVISQTDDLIMQSYNALNGQIRAAFILFFVLMAVLIIAVVLISNGYSKRFTRPIIDLKAGVDDIGDGNWDHQLNIKTGDEIEDLGNAFNEMASNLDIYVKTLTAVTAEKERIGAELNVASHIQSSMLPCIFPAFPDRKEIDIYATMNPAKEVGGDFYDFFMVDDRHVAIVMADVSGKGVPAALFMVIGKTLIKDHTQTGKDLGEVFSKVNNLLCESNSEGLFITAFEGVLDMVTGEFTFVNAGHEMPFVSKAGGAYKPYKIKPGFVLAGMEDMMFRGGSIMLEPGDKIFQYTDGVTEATDKNEKLFGMERLEQTLSTCGNMTPEELLPTVKKAVDDFVGTAPQFDDITMLCLHYRERMVEE